MSDEALLVYTQAPIVLVGSVPTETGHGKHDKLRVHHDPGNPWVKKAFIAFLPNRYTYQQQQLLLSLEWQTLTFVEYLFAFQ